MWICDIAVHYVKETVCHWVFVRVIGGTCQKAKCFKRCLLRGPTPCNNTPHLRDRNVTVPNFMLLIIKKTYMSGFLIKTSL
jgi:hypothetical protein